jgi:hypothetical protein
MDLIEDKSETTEYQIHDYTGVDFDGCQETIVSCTTKEECEAWIRRNNGRVGALDYDIIKLTCMSSSIECRKLERFDPVVVLFSDTDLVKFTTAIVVEGDYLYYEHNPVNTCSRCRLRTRTKNWEFMDVWEENNVDRLLDTAGDREFIKAVSKRRKVMSGKLCSELV